MDLVSSIALSYCCVVLFYGVVLWDDRFVGFIRGKYVVVE